MPPRGAASKLLRLNRMRPCGDSCHYAFRMRHDGVVLIGGADATSSSFLERFACFCEPISGRPIELARPRSSIWTLRDRIDRWELHHLGEDLNEAR